MPDKKKSGKPSEVIGTMGSSEHLIRKDTDPCKDGHQIVRTPIDGHNYYTCESCGLVTQLYERFFTATEHKAALQAQKEKFVERLEGWLKVLTRDCEIKQKGHEFPELVEMILTIHPKETAKKILEGGDENE